MNYEKLINDCEAHIRAGQDQKAIRAIAELEITKVPRVWRLPLAALCRRTAHVATGLKLLSSIVSPKSNLRPTSAELAEYAALLQKYGAVEDALRILDKVDSREVPIVLLFKAVCHFNRWEYPSAIPLLQQYITTIESPYQSLVGRVNLAAALVAVDSPDAVRFLHENIRLARESDSSRLEGNCHELLTQVHMLNGRVGEARECLARAESLIAGPESLDKLFTNKCRAFLASIESKRVEPLLAFRTEALRWPHAETVREVDLFRLVVSYDESLHEHLHFGTPFAFYRQRMERLLSKELKSSQFMFGRADGPYLDIATGECSRGAGLKVGNTVHRVLSALLGDFYRPVRMGNLFGRLFPGEHFDIHSSPLRVHQSLSRARRWLSSNSIPVEIREVAGSYSLHFAGDFSFRLLSEREAPSKRGVLLTKLIEMFPSGQVFTALAAREKLGLTSSAFHRFLQPLIETGQVQKFGASSSTIYFIAPTAKRPAA